jgi:hypothetical protein
MCVHILVPLNDIQHVSVVYCQVEVSATGWSLVHRSPTEHGVSKVCDREASKTEAA